MSWRHRIVTVLIVPTHSIAELLFCLSVRGLAAAHRQGATGTAPPAWRCHRTRAARCGPHRVSTGGAAGAAGVRGQVPGSSPACNECGLLQWLKCIVQCLCGVGAGHCTALNMCSEQPGSLVYCNVYFI